MEEQHLSRAERRALKKQMHEEHRREARGKANIGKMLWTLLILLVLGGLAAWIISGFFAEKPGVKVAIQSREHINLGSSHDPYTSNPPVSGPHHPQWSKCGIFEDEIAMETLIHNMEHGHVVVLYKPGLEASQKEALKNFVKGKLDRENILMAPNKDIPSPIAFASWGWFELFETFNEEAFNTFYKSHKYRAPEKIPCDVEEMD